MDAGLAAVTWRSGGFVSSPLELSLLQLVDVIAELQRGSQLQSQVFHDHVAPQQQQGIAVNLLEGRQRTVRAAKWWLRSGCAHGARKGRCADEREREHILLVLGELLGTIKASNHEALLFASPPGTHLPPCTFQGPALF